MAKKKEYSITVVHNNIEKVSIKPSDRIRKLEREAMLESIYNSEREVAFLDLKKKANKGKFVDKPREAAILEYFSTEAKPSFKGYLSWCKKKILPSYGSTQYKAYKAKR